MNLDVILPPLVDLLTSPQLLFLMALAVPIGAFFGALPGLGGKLGIVLLIPFVFGMQPIPGAVFLLAMHAVVHTGGSIPSILFGVPGDGPTAATVIDGYEMTKKGQAGRALGASLGASGIGGVIGAIFLAIMLPVIEPIVLSVSPAEFFLIALLGITFIATLSGDSLLKGLIVGFFGLMIAFIGLDPSTGVARYTFGQLFLWDGIDVITAAIAVFALPEMMAIGVKRLQFDTPQETSSYRMREVWEGLVDCVRHWGLTLRTSVLGALVGLIPGLGGDVAAWLCYGHAVQSSKTPERFGKGAVEGVIAPETANNSKEGGSLLPTLFFGIPGSSGMAIMLGAFVTLGLQPGPKMMTEHLDLVWYLIWALVISNILCVVFLIACAPWVGRLAMMRTSLLIPFVIVFCLLGSYFGARAWQNLPLLLIFGGIGYLLKRHKWPRPPLVIGLVLGPIAEESLHKALALWGPSFLLRPLSLAIIALIVASLAIYVVRLRQPKVAYDL